MSDSRLVSARPNLLKKAWQKVLVETVQLRRVLSFVAGTFMVLTAGTLYGFGAYSQNLAKALDRDNVQLLGSMGDIGTYLGLTMGLLFDFTGPAVTSLVACLFTFMGYFFTWLVLENHIPNSFALLCLFYFLIGQGSYASVVATIGCNVSNFPPAHKGKVSGFFVGLYGFSSLVFTLIYQYGLDYDVRHFFFLLSMCVAATNLFGLIFLRKVPSPQAYATLSGPLPPKVTSLEATQLLLVEEDAEDSNDDDDADDGEKEKQLNNKQNQESEEEDLGGPSSSDPWDPACKPYRMILRLEFWLLFITFFCISGIGLMWKNIVGSVTASFDMSKSVTNVYVIIFGSLNSVSRVLVGIASDLLVRFVPRPLWFILSAALMLVVYLSYLIFGEKVLILIDIGTAVGYGVTFATVIALTITYFGLPYYGMNSSIITLAPAGAGFLLTYVSEQLTESVTPSDSSECKGNVCYKWNFLVASCFLILAILVSSSLLVYHVRREKLHRRELFLQKQKEIEVY